MNHSKWQINRAGLIDFWYYDEEVFEFSDGRILLRGSNGSGKSVTMQSFIPLLLDGNMRPERLDPFGSKARKMENYLLEEDDVREERTGYLFIEFKRMESEEYMTFGLGIRARKNKKLESWYFCITDGRRVGYDILLYKDIKNKITCSKTELRNRIGDGGKVMETQGEYAVCVNRLLFGFETQEEYKELLELLIQLRTPKLSKEFKPTVINEILSRSLQTLSEDDLRPMSEAVENMDNLKTSLDILNESIRGAKQIEKVYDQYNSIVLYDKALLFLQASKDCESCENEVRMLKVCEKENMKAQAEEKQYYEKLAREEEVLKKEKESLANSDAAKLKGEEIQLLKQLSEKEEERNQKEQQKQEKEERLLDAEKRLKKEIEKKEIVWKEIEDCLEEMEGEIEDIPFDEFVFMKKEILEDRLSDYSFEPHRQILTAYIQKVEKAKEGLTEELSCQEKYDRYLKELDLYKEERNCSEREVQQYEKLMDETKAELIEHIHIWEEGNEELLPDQQVMQAIVRKVQEYEYGSDYSEIKALMKPVFYEKEKELAKENLLIKQQLEQERVQLQAINEELEAWRHRREPEPEQPECVCENRRLLKEAGIPYDQFYKTIDFGGNIDEAIAGKIEEALLHMGVLDALIIPEEYRTQVFAMDGGVCDKYIFGDAVRVRENIGNILEVDNGENDILLYQRISNVLSSIGFENEDADTRIDKNGNYKLGILEGTVTGGYRARFIGARARERYKLEQIEILECLCRNKKTEIAVIETNFQKNKQRSEILENEWADFPSENDLKTASKALADSEYGLELAIKRVGSQQILVENERKTLDKIRLKVRELCEKCYLLPRMDVFVEALKALRSYNELFSKLQIVFSQYKSSCRYVTDQSEYIEEIEADLEAIRYDLSRILQKIRELAALLDSVKTQLEMTDYEEIKERLDYCIKQLEVLPGMREKSIGKQSRLSKEADILSEKINENENKQKVFSDKTERYRKIFEQEYRLGYVHIQEEAGELQYIAEKICSQFAGSFGNKKQSDIFGNLQAVYHQNRGCLLDYQMTLVSLFSELDEGNEFLDMSAKRIDIMAKYRGVQVKFKELLEKLSEDVQEKIKIISDRDRELFEDILANTISKKIRTKIQASRRWIDKMNMLMDSMETSSGLKLSLKWKQKRAETEEQLDTRILVELMQKDVEIMRPEEIDSLAKHFRSKIEEARKISGETGAVQSFHAVMKEVLDYRKWFEFQLECQKSGEKKKELTDRVFFTFSGGEKAMAMYVPLFSAVVAKYAGARSDAPKLISLDEAFAGVDETNIRDMFRLMVEFEFNFMINSQILWGDYDTVPALAIYQLIRPENVKFVSVIRYLWNGKQKLIVT